MPLEVWWLVLLGAAVAARSEAQEPLDGVKPLCKFELPSDASCTLQGTAVGSCSIHMLPEESCFQVWDDARNSTSFIKGQDFTHNLIEGVEGNTTVLRIYNYKGTRFLVITMLPEETWWQVDVPKGEHNITITGLPGSLNETTPLANAAFYEGCPPPRINYRAFRQLHKMEIFVTPLEEHNKYFPAEASVSIQMASSNKTNFSNCISSYQIDFETGGVIGDPIHIEEVYSTEFCFMIGINSSDGMQRRYSCGIQEIMTGPPFHPVQKVVEPPTWWAMGLIFLVILLALSSLGPRAVQKGLAARRRGRDGRPLLPAPVPATTHALCQGERWPPKPAYAESKA